MVMVIKKKSKYKIISRIFRLTTIGIYYGKSQLCFRIQCIVHTVLVSHTKTFATKHSKRALSVQHNISYRFIVHSQLQTSYSSVLDKGNRVSNSILGHRSSMKFYHFIINFAAQNEFHHFNNEILQPQLLFETPKANKVSHTFL